MCPEMGEYILRSKVASFDRDMEAASGDVSYTGYGFKPRALIIHGSVDGVDGSSLGFADSDKASICRYQLATAFDRIADKVIQLYQAGGKYQSAVVKSYDADGFTLTWTKSGVPAASTGEFFVLALG